MNNFNQTLNGMNNFFQMRKNAGAYLSNMIIQNPQYQAILNQMRNSGLSSQQFCEQLAKQRGINLDAFSQQISQMANTLNRY